MNLGLLAQMSGALIAVLVVVGLLLLLVLMAVAAYNALVVLRNQYKNAYAQIDVQLRRRYDLIPNLVETVKGYMAHERDTLEGVISARNAAFNANQRAAANPGDPQTMEELNRAEAQLASGLGRLFALAEAYPDLKANQTMATLQEELTATENKIAFARQAYNDAATAYNTKRESFPSNIFAGMFGFTEAKLLESIETPAQREAPKVAFGTRQPTTATNPPGAKEF
jgi:LemA protein